MLRIWQKRFVDFRKGNIMNKGKEARNPYNPVLSNTE